MIIKILLLLGLLVVGVVILRSRMTAGHLALRRVAAVSALAAGAGAVLFPIAVTKVANLMGVGRGTDLVLYLLVLAFLFVSVAAYRRMHELENRIVLLARQVAISEALTRHSDLRTETEPEVVEQNLARNTVRNTASVTEG